MQAQGPSFEALVAAFERDPRFTGKRTADIPFAADFRLHYRGLCYRLANFQFGVALFNLLIASVSAGFFHWLNCFGFGFSFCGMFMSEFRARRFTAELNRPAAEQLARDLLRFGDL